MTAGHFDLMKRQGIFGHGYARRRLVGAVSAPGKQARPSSWRILPSVIGSPGGFLLAISERHQRAEYIAAALSTATCTTN
jgi:hypothetical protein